MKKLRWTLLLLALGIALPAALIVQRAIASLKLENAVRHEAVAERVFDEMERTLSDFLLREESRPPGDYSADPASPADGIAPSAFASADEPFILGWFTRDARGRTRILALGSIPAERVETAVGKAFGTPTQRQEREALTQEIEEIPAPGRTKSIGRASVEQRRLADTSDPERLQSSAYEVLQSLNRAQRLRSERQTKAIREQASLRKSKPSTEGSILLEESADFALRDEDWDSADMEAEATAGFRAADAQAPAAPTEPLSLPEPSAAAGSELDAFEELGPPPTEAALAAAARLDATAEEEQSRPSVDPLIGRTTPAGDLVLARSVWRAGVVERQGLVLDRTSLIAWLETQVVAETGLSERVSLEFGSHDPDAPVDVPHRYLHRFAEPFDALIARLDLEPLPGLGSARPIYALAVMLGLVAAFGLFAVERMTRVVVDYAQRRSDFVAAVSHELKTPLTSIRMYGEMLRDGLVADDRKRAEYHATITDEAERLSRLIDNVLEFSRLEQDRRDLSMVVGGLSEAILEAAEKLRAHVEREGFRLRLELADGLPPVRYDRDAVTQLVFNLVDNALKYAHQAKTREIEIALGRVGEGIELRVRDFGPGVPEAQLRRVFEPFYRVGEELTRSTKGSGIGLALVKELAGRMGAVVRGRNAVDGGFEVCIAFEAAR